MCFPKRPKNVPKVGIYYGTYNGNRCWFLTCGDDEYGEVWLFNNEGLRYSVLSNVLSSDALLNVHFISSHQVT